MPDFTESLFGGVLVSVLGLGVFLVASKIVKEQTQPPPPPPAVSFTGLSDDSILFNTYLMTHQGRQYIVVTDSHGLSIYPLQPQGQNPPPSDSNLSPEKCQP